jgi:hypothetical protein
MRALLVATLVSVIPALTAAQSGSQNAADSRPQAPSPTDQVTLSSVGPIATYVKGAGSAGGFSDPSRAREDSVKDLIQKLKSVRAVRLVDSEKDAVILIEVTERGTKREVNSNGSSQRDGHQQESRLGPPDRRGLFHRVLG